MNKRIHQHLAFVTLCSLSLLHCGGQIGVGDQANEIGDGDQANEAGDAQSVRSAESTGSNPAVFDLHCLWAGEAYASRAPTAVAAQAIRNACDIQAHLVPYGAGWAPIRDRAPQPNEVIDCSGLTANSYYRASNHAVRLPWSAAYQEATLPAVKIAAPGDLIFYKSAEAFSGRHVAMYLGDNLMIEAAGYKVGVIVSTVRPGFTSVRRVVQ